MSGRFLRSRPPASVAVALLVWPSTLAAQCEPSWHTVGGDPFGAVRAFAVSPSSPTLYAGGTFTAIGGVKANRVARWDGAAWSPLGEGVGSNVRAMAVFNDGSGEALFVGASVPVGPNQTVQARWANETWTVLTYGANRMVTDIEVVGIGGGLQLYAAWWSTYPFGGFSTVDRWTGSSWNSVYNQSTFLKIPYSPRFQALAPSWTLPGKLFIGGNFGYNNPPYYRPGPLVSYNGATVVPEGGPDLLPGPDIRVLQSVNGAPGPGLFVGGSFGPIAGVTANNIAKWTGASWSTLHEGVNGTVNALAAFDDGRGPGVFVGGAFTSSGGTPLARIARWDGTDWSELGAGLPMPVEALLVFDDDGPGPRVARLYAGGSNFLLAWGCEHPAPCYPDCDVNGTLNPADFGCFQGKYVLGDLYADCNASGNLTVADFGCFQGKYVLGCP